MPAEAAVIEVTDADFAAKVLEKSKEVPVVVDFWAPWCGPCRMLGPIIERVAAQYNGKVILAKLNTDENPRTAMQYNIRGIPAVKAFRDGRVVAEFVGALPEPQVRAFFERVVGAPANPALAAAQAALQAGDLTAAEAKFREVLAAEPSNRDAIVGLGDTLARLGRTEEAEALLARLPADRQAKVIRHRIFLEGFARRHAGEDLAGEAARNPRDPRARYRYGVWLAAQGQYERALDELLESVRLDRNFADGAARKAMLAIFDILGLDSPVTKEYQRKLAQALF